MRVDLRGSHVAVAEQFLDGADVVAALEEVGCEAVAQGVAGGTPVEASAQDGLLDDALDRGLVGVVS